MRRSRTGLSFFKRGAGINSVDKFKKGIFIDDSQQINKYRLNLDKQLLRRSDNLDVKIKKLFAKQSECQLNSVSTLKNTKSKLLLELSISSDDKSIATEILKNFVKKVAKPKLNNRPLC